MNYTWLALGFAFLAIGFVFMANVKKAEDAGAAKNAKLTSALFFVAASLFFIAAIVSFFSAESA